ncbi:HPr kinase/phosphorylase [Segnochrobactraceae bacterium EtOH-i3]
MSPPTIHATAIRFDGHGLLLRGASGSGKSTLARLLLERAALSGRDACLVADDRVILTVDAAGALIASPPAALAGLLEVAGLGIIAMSHAPAVPLALVVDLVSEDNLERMPDAASRRMVLAGVALPRVAVPRRSALTPGLVDLAIATLVTGRIRLLP